MVRGAIEQHRDGSGGPVRVLDFGCGRGAVELYDFRSSGVRVCGADVDPVVLVNPMLDEAKVIKDGRLGWPDGTFDVICSSHVLEHVPDPARTLSELHRVLKPGGHVVAVTPNARALPALVARVTPSSFHRWVNAKRGRRTVDTFPTLYRLNTVRQVTEAASGSGFTVEMLEYWEGRPEYFLFSRWAFYIGLAWERLVNRCGMLAGLRSSLFIVLRK
jgi:SAM-dependent methyltransferase